MRIMWLAMALFILVSLGGWACFLLGLLKYGRSQDGGVDIVQNDSFPASRDNLYSKSTSVSAEFSFKVSYPELRRGLRERHPVAVAQVAIGLGMSFGAGFAIAAIGAGLMAGKINAGILFMGFGLLLPAVFCYQLKYGTEPKPSPGENKPIPAEDNPGHPPRP